MSSCAGVRVERPQESFVISTKYMSVTRGLKNFDHTKGVDEMGAWVGERELVEWSKLPNNLFCFPLKVYLEEIKPAFKALARKYRDDND